MSKRKLLLALVAAVLIILISTLAVPLALAKTANAGPVYHPVYLVFKTVSSGETWVVDRDTHVVKLVIQPGATVKAPDGYSLTMTVKGVETGQKLVSTYGVETAVQAGSYWDVWLNVKQQNVVSYAAGGPPGAPPTYLNFPFRQAIYVDAHGLSYNCSVLRAVQGGVVRNAYAKNISITSTGECFNGIYVTNGGTYTVKNATIRLTGNGRSDFIGYGAALVANGGSDTKLVVDRSTIINQGVVRTAVVADGGANVIVKNSTIETYAGILPADYEQTIDTTQMRSIPWMLGMNSSTNNVRATNLLGEKTKATYIDSYLYSSGWGVLSTDGCREPKLTAINCTIATGPEGYGSYCIGNATEHFLGCMFNVGTYATICRGGTMYYGPSTKSAVAQVNNEYGIGLTAGDLAAIAARNTVVNSSRFGVMWHGDGAAYVSGATVFNTKEAVFLDKGQKVTVEVDGSLGARLNPANGTIFQLMDDDDPGPVPPKMTNTGIYKQPTDPVSKNTDHDIYNTTDSDAVCTFKNITLKGNFFNGMRGDLRPAFPPGAPAIARNLVLNFSGASVTGVITAAETLHYVDTITSDNYYELGRVYNVPRPAVNNGVLVSLTNGSTWTVTGTCYLTRLELASGCLITAPGGKAIKMTVNGSEVAPEPGHTYVGDIVITLVPATP